MCDRAQICNGDLGIGCCAADRAHLIPIELRQARLAVHLDGNLHVALPTAGAVQKGRLALVQLLVQVKVLHTPAHNRLNSVCSLVNISVWPCRNGDGTRTISAVQADATRHAAQADKDNLWSGQR